MAGASDPETLYETYGPALVRKAERLLRNRDDAIDVVHGLFTDLLQRRRRPLDLPYLYRAVNNRCLNLLRDRKNRTRLLERQDPALCEPARSRLDDRVMALDLLARLAGELDDKTFDVLVLLYVDDLTQDEAAEACGTSRRTIGKRVQKIRRALSRMASAPASGRGRAS